MDPAHILPLTLLAIAGFAMLAARFAIPRLLYRFYLRRYCRKRGLLIVSARDTAPGLDILGSFEHKIYELTCLDVRTRRYAITLKVGVLGILTELSSRRLPRKSDADETDPLATETNPSATDTAVK